MNLEDPFVDSESGDFNVLLCSEAINNGNNNFHPYSIAPTDYNGNPRIVDGEIDMGAFEAQTAKPNPGSISGRLTLNLGGTATYTTNGDVGGVWSSKEGIIQMDASGLATVSYTRFGLETIYYSFDVGGCMISAQFSVNVPAPDIYPNNNVLYVDPNNTTNIPNGYSWNSAIPDLAEALKWAKNNESSFNESNPLKIYVAEGTYNPKYSAEDGANFSAAQEEDKAFLLVKNTQVYGGFSPSRGATDLASRDWVAYPTILDGNNSVYHVVVANSLPSVNLFDGFIVQGGNASSNSTYNAYSKEVYHYRGGAMVINESSITIQNCLFRNNHSEQWGGALYVIGSNGAKVINSIFDSNTAAQEGLAINVQSTSTAFELINCTFYNDPTLAGTKSAINYWSASATVSNSIFYGGTIPVKQHNGVGNAVYRNSYFNVAGWSAVWGANQVGNILNTTNPFVDAEGGDFNLTICSDAVNAGNNSYFANASTATDYYGNSRVFRGTIDMGAVERQQPTVLEFLPIGPFCTTEEPEDLIVNIAGGVFSGTGVSNGKFDPQIAGEGVHEITYTITEGICVVSETIFVEVEDCISTNIDTDKANNIEVYPNPAYDVVTINLQEASLIRIVSLSGSIVAQHKLSEGENSVNIQNLTSGVYQIQIINRQTEVYKFVKK